MGSRLSDPKASAILDGTCNTDTYTLHLYKNDVTPGVGMVIGDFDECDFDGYAPQDYANWSAAAYIPGNDEYNSSPDPVVFTAGAAIVPQDVYGVFVTDSFGNLVWAERDPVAPQTMSNPGDTYTVNTTAVTPMT